MKAGDTVKVLAGVYAGKIGTVKAVATGVPKSIGVSIGDAMTIVWFMPDEVEAAL